MINAAHAIIFSRDAEADRGFFKYPLCANIDTAVGQLESKVIRLGNEPRRCPMSTRA
jgi:hypothetical protein